MSNMEQMKDMKDMIDGGGFGQSGDEFADGPMSELLNAMGIRPRGYRARQREELGATRPQARPQGRSQGGSTAAEALPILEPPSPVSVSKLVEEDPRGNFWMPETITAAKEPMNDLELLKMLTAATR